MHMCVCVRERAEGRRRGDKGPGEGGGEKERGINFSKVIAN